MACSRSTIYKVGYLVGVSQSDMSANSHLGAIGKSVLIPILHSYSQLLTVKGLLNLQFTYLLSYSCFDMIKI